MQLAVKAGSIDEATISRGSRTCSSTWRSTAARTSRPGELIATLESTGARHGPARQRLHVGSTRRSTCSISRPIATGIVEKGLQALADFAGGMLLDTSEIDKERGVVVEEWRGGLGAGSRLRDQQIPVLYHQSRYAERLPIGKPEILKAFTPERLRAFYTKWYRPDRMAVVVVGDLDPPKIEAMIRDGVRRARKPATAPPPARNYPVPLHAEVLYNIATDPEVTQSSVSIVQKRPREPQDRVADYPPRRSSTSSCSRC